MSRLTVAESRDTSTLGGSLRWIRAGLVLSFAALVTAAFVYQGGIDFPPINDEEQFWKQVEAFVAAWPPGLAALRDYEEPMTPLAFLFWSGLEVLLGLGLPGGRLATLATSFAVLAVIGLRRPRPGMDDTAPVLAAFALLLYPYWVPISVLLYTDVPASLLLVIGFALHARERHRAAAFAFVLAIATRQYLVTFPAALVAHEGLRAWRAGELRLERWGPYALAAATLLGWVAFFGGLGPANGLEKWPRHSSALLEVHPSYALYYLATVGGYFVALEFVLYRRWRTTGLRPGSRVALAIAAVAVLHLVFPLDYHSAIGLGDRTLRFFIGNSALADALRHGLLIGLAAATLLRFSRLGIGFWVVAAYGAIFPLLWSPWEKYAMPILATLWLLKSVGALEDESATNDSAGEAGTA